MESVLVASSALVVGFLAGLLAFRRKSRWCPTCGSTFTCPDTAEHHRFPVGDRPRRSPNTGHSYHRFPR
jgi:hypothetical protein